jgi:hypothetical protein
MAKRDLRCLMWSARIFWSPHWTGLYLVCCRGTNRYRMVVCTRLTGGHLWSLSNNRRSPTSPAFRACVDSLA